MLVPLIANADTVEIDGIYYNLNSKEKHAEVTSHPNNYKGTVAIPNIVFYNSDEYNVISIDQFAFKSCCELTSITIPNSITSIVDYAFWGCSGLTSLTIPNSVTSIGEGAFLDCSGLISIIVEDGNATYDSRANCNAIIETASNKLIVGCMNTTIPNDVTCIGMSAFRGCSGLSSITIPNSVTSIDDWAFQNSNLTSIIIPNSVTSIGRSAFYGCLYLTTITIPPSVTSIGSSAFEGGNSLTTVHITDLYAWLNINYDYNSNPLFYAHHLYLNNNEITDLEIPNNISSIGNEVLAGWSALTSVTIPNSVTSIGDRAFRGCSGLTRMDIPNSVTSIGEEAFHDCNALTSVEIPNSVTAINKFTFQNCSNLTSVTIPNSVTSIGMSAFAGCKSLNSITIPNSVTSIDDYAFQGCKSLTSIEIPNNVTSIGHYAFSENNMQEVITKIENPFNIDTKVFSDKTYNGTLFVPAGTIDKYKAAEGWKNFKSIIESDPSNITIIDNNGANEYKRYTLDGRVRKNSYKGINIIQMNNGTVKKVLVK